MKKILILGMCAAPFFFTSCGGAETADATTEVDSIEVVEEVASIAEAYTIDTEMTVINWNNFNGEDTDHVGTVKALAGKAVLTTTGDVTVITEANLIVDMNSVSEPSEKLVGHLKAADFFDVNQFATTEFTFDRHENDMIYGTASIIGKEIAVEAPATVMTEEGKMTVEVGAFKLDFGALEMPFFVTEAAEVENEEERHSAMIGFSATIVGNVAH